MRQWGMERIYVMTVGLIQMRPLPTFCIPFTVRTGSHRVQAFLPKHRAKDVKPRESGTSQACMSMFSYDFHTARGCMTIDSSTLANHAI